MLTFSKKEKKIGKSSSFSHLEPMLDKNYLLTYTQFMLHSHETIVVSRHLFGLFFSLTYFTPKYFASIPLIFKRIWCMWFIWFIFIHQKLSCFPLGMLYQKLFFSFMFVRLHFLFLTFNTIRIFFYHESPQNYKWIPLEISFYFSLIKT